ncbi:MAG: S-layer homology domain-containing protein [Bacillota bacterium]|nr:S-layer homology domain-containing protein [Bacillota bacterium]
MKGLPRGRAALALLLLLLAFPGKALAAPALSPTFFLQAPSAPYGEAMERLAALGILAANPGLSSQATLTRQDMVDLLIRYMNQEGLAKALLSSQPPFPDAKDIRPALRGAIYAGYVLGWIQGYPDGTLKPQKGVTLGEALALILKAKEVPLPQDLSWEEGVLKKARDLGLLQNLKDFSFSRLATWGEVAQILWNDAQRSSSPWEKAILKGRLREVGETTLLLGEKRYPLARQPVSPAGSWEGLLQKDVLLLLNKEGKAAYIAPMAKAPAVPMTEVKPSQEAPSPPAPRQVLSLLNTDPSQIPMGLKPAVKGQYGLLRDEEGKDFLFLADGVLQLLPSQISLKEVPSPAAVQYVLLGDELQSLEIYPLVPLEPRFIYLADPKEDKSLRLLVGGGPRNEELLLTEKSRIAWDGEILSLSLAKGKILTELSQGRFPLILWQAPKNPESPLPFVYITGQTKTGLLQARSSQSWTIDGEEVPLLPGWHLGLVPENGSLGLDQLASVPPGTYVTTLLWQGKIFYAFAGSPLPERAVVRILGWETSLLGTHVTLDYQGTPLTLPLAPGFSPRLELTYAYAVTDKGGARIAGLQLLTPVYALTSKGPVVPSYWQLVPRAMENPDVTARRMGQVSQLTWEWVAKDELDEPILGPDGLPNTLNVSPFQVTFYTSTGTWMPYYLAGGRYRLYSQMGDPTVKGERVWLAVGP